MDDLLESYGLAEGRSRDDTPPDEGKSTHEVARELEVTYRRLHYWVTQGLIPGLRTRGTGSCLRWSPEHVEAARRVRDAFDESRRLRQELREQVAS